MGAFEEAAVLLKLKELLKRYLNGTTCSLQSFQTMNVESASKTSHVTHTSGGFLYSAFPGFP
jgi:hypothetical protein